MIRKISLLENQHENIPYSQPPGGFFIKPKRQRFWINIVLFCLTIFTTILAGAGHQFVTWKDIWHNYTLLLSGVDYAFAVLLILTFHEFGHYLTARWHGLRVTLPYYIPVPLEGFHFGTMGAFIRIRSPIPNRTVLMDVAIGGPLAGFVVSLFFLSYGYLTLPDTDGIITYVESMHPWVMAADGGGLTLGKSLLFMFFNDVIAHGRLPMYEVYHFPFIFAGWIGLLVTAINLLPIGQLDGGHIIYALLGRKSRIFNRMAFGGMIGICVLLYYFRGPLGIVWIPWILILTFIGIYHPPTLDDAVPLTPKRRFLGWMCLLIFVICFMPLPVYIQ